MKGKDRVKRKMLERVKIAGPELIAGMDEAEDPLDVILKDPEGKTKALVAGVQEAAKRDSYIVGVKKAKARDSWNKSKPRAGAHYEERADDMVENSMADYDERMASIEAAIKEVEDMPTTTRDQRIAKSQAYLKAVGKKFDLQYGRK